MLKVSFPHPGNVHEPDAFAVWRGRGAVLLHARDDERFAMLLERARTTTLAQTADGDELLTVAGRINRRLAVPAPPGLPRLRERADAWEEQLRRDTATLPHRLPRHGVAAAVATVRELGRGRPDTLVHGDLHARKILRVDREPWLAVATRPVTCRRTCGALSTCSPRPPRSIESESGAGPNCTPFRARSTAVGMDSAGPARGCGSIGSSPSPTTWRSCSRERTPGEGQRGSRTTATSPGGTVTASCSSLPVRSSVAPGATGTSAPCPAWSMTNR